MVLILANVSDEVTYIRMGEDKFSKTRVKSITVYAISCREH